MSAVDMHDVTERFTRYARIGWAVTKLANQGAVEFRLDQIEDAARALEWPDLAYAIDKGGDLLDGPTLLTDEPTGDAMHWTSCLPSLGSPCGNCHRCTPIPSEWAPTAEVGNSRDRCTCAYVGARGCVNPGHNPRGSQ